MIGGEGGDFNEVVGNIFPIKFVSHEIGKKTFATFEKMASTLTLSKQVRKVQQEPMS